MAVQIDVRANAEQAQRSLNQLNNSVKNIESSANNVNKSFVNLGKVANFAAIAITAAFTGNAVTRAGDTYKRLNSQLRLVTKNAQSLAVAQQNVNRIAIQTRNNIESTANLYARLNRSATQLGKSQADTAKATKAISQAIQISGASASSAQAAIIQLGQGLASGTLRGEELNSVLEQAPRIARAIADELGVGVGQLRKIASEGKITSEVVFKALVNQSAQINKEFQQVSLTVSQATSVLNTGMTTFLAALDKSLGLSTGLAKRIVIVGKALNDFGSEFEDRISILQSRLVIFRIKLINAFRNTASIVSDFFSNITFKDLSFDIKSETFQKAKDKIEDIKNKIKSISNFKINIDFSGISSTLNTIKEFTNKIYDFFYNLYIELVGNSIVPDMVSAIIDQFLNLKAKGIKVISGFISNIENSFNKILEHELTQKGLSKLKNSIDELKETSTFSRLENALSSAKVKAIEIGTTLKDAFNTTFKLDESSKTNLQAGFSAALIAAINATSVRDAFKFAIENAGKIVKPLAVLTVTETFGTQLAKVLNNDVNFEAIGRRIGEGFNDLLNKAGSSGTQDLGVSLASGFLDLVSGAFQGAFIDASVEESLTNLVTAAFIAAIVSTTARAALGSTLLFAFTGGALSDKIGIGASARPIDIDKPAEKAILNAQRALGFAGSIAGGLFAKGVAEELGASPAGQIGAAIAGGLVSGAGAVLLARAGVVIAAGIGTGLSAAAAAAGLTAAGGVIASSILLILGGLGATLLFPEKTQKLVRAVFGDAAGDFVLKVNESLTSFGDRIAKLFDSILRGLGLKTDAPKVSQNEAEVRKATIEQLKVLRNTLTLSRNQDILLKILIKNAENTKNTNIELAKQLNSFTSRFQDNEAISAELNKLSSALENVTTLQDIERSNAPRSGRSPVQIPMGENFRDQQIVNLESLLEAIDPSRDPNSAQSVTTAINAIQDSSKTLIDVAKDLENLAESTRLLSGVKSSLQSLATSFRAETKRILDAQTQRSKAEMFRQGIPETFANGGRVFGSGTSKSDSIPAMLSNGEFVVNAKSTSRNLGLLSAINNGYQNGGYVAKDGDSLTTRIKKEEGYGKLGAKGDAKNKSYLDHLGYPTIGYGRLLEDKKYTKDAFAKSSLSKKTTTPKLAASNLVDYLNDVAIPDIRSFIGNASFDALPNIIKEIATSLAYNVGGNRLLKFEWFKQAILNQDYETAAEELLDSQAASGAPLRYADLATALSSKVTMLDELPSYFSKGVKARMAAGKPIPEAFKSYFVKKNQHLVTTGDTISGILKLYGISKAELYRKNPKLDPDPNKLQLGKVLNYANGGRVTGPGTGRSDSIPAMLSNGEFVVNAKSTARNRPLLESINRPGFKDGGLAGTIKQLQALTNKTVSLSDFIKLEEKDRNTIQLALDGIQAATNELAFSNTEDAERLKTEIVSLTEIVDGNLQGIAKQLGEEGVADPSVFEKIFSGINLNDAGTAAARSFTESLKQAILTGEGGGIKALGKTFLDTFTRNVVDQFFNQLNKEFTDKLFSKDGPFDFDKLAEGFSSLLSSAFSGITSALSGTGIGNLLGIGTTTATAGSMFTSVNLAGNSGFSPSFDVGGVVPGMPGQPVPALVHGGEVILNREQQRAVFERGAGVNGTTTVNLNVTGDVSRQTRSEIERMIPQITSGVNQRNAETGFDRR